MDRVYSDKQRELLALWQKGGLRRLNLLEGSVRSGKTWISLVLWAFWVASMPKDGSFLMAAKTLTSLRRNCLELLETLVGPKHFRWSLSKKEGRLFGRAVFFEGASDARAESKIRGMTLSGAYCDELSLFSEDFFSMLLSRLSAPGAKLIGTTNPDSPYHWLKEKYLNRAGELDLLAVRFLIGDNAFLDPQYVENLKKEYTGVFYERFILGEWVVASGLVYPDFDESRHVVRECPEGGRCYISVDYGTMNPCSMGFWRIVEGKAYRVREFYHDGRKTGRQMTDEEYYGALVRLAGGEPVQYVVADPSAASFIECIRRHGEFSVKKADNRVLDGIRMTSSFLGAGRLLFGAECKDSRKEFRSYRWDEKAAEDRVVKENDHAMDDIRYFCSTVLRHEFRGDSWAVEE